MRLSSATLTLAVPDFPSTVAVIVTGPPTAMPTSCPAGVIEATAGLLLLQVNVLASRPPEASRASALARTVSPTRMVAGRVTATVATGCPPPEPVMLNPPQPVAAARPAMQVKRSECFMGTRRGGPSEEVGIDVVVSRRGRQRLSPRARALCHCLARALGPGLPQR